MSSKGRIPLLVDSNGVKQENARDKAEILNKQFCSVFTLDDGIVPPFPMRTDSFIETIDVSAENVLKVLRQLPLKTACGPDGIPQMLLKKCAAALSSPMSAIFKSSFEEGKLPHDWLDAIVVPIYKRKGNNSDPVNYRPISLTCTSCKVMERIVKSAVMLHLQAENLLHPSQHGFRSKKSTLTNMLSCLHHWYQAVDAGDVIHCAYLDFAKAFDTVPHPQAIAETESIWCWRPTF
jgi:hypothetical protein